MVRLENFVLLSVSLLLSSKRDGVSASSTGNKQCGLTVPSSVTNRPAKTLIAHRGASYHLPEHTLAAYRLALELGADYIEPDLLSTKDGKLVAYHSLDLNITTDVAKVFPGRTSFSDFANRTGYWVYDFDLEEILKLKVRQRLPDARSTLEDGQYGIPTLQDILELLHQWNRDMEPLVQSSKKRAGLYAELKDPKWFDSEKNLKLTDMLINELSTSPHANSMFNDTDCAALKFDEYLTPPLVVQCFDGETLKDLSEQWSQNYGTPPPMVVLGGIEDCLEEDWWFHIGEWSHFVHGVGPDKKCLAEEVSAVRFMERAKEHELAVHVWTERPENEFVLKEFDNFEQEMDYLLCNVGVHGMFTEDVARSAVAIAKGCGDAPPTASPTADSKIPAEDGACPNTSGLNEDAAYLAVAAGIMGVLVGCVTTVALMNSRFCKSRRHTRRQLRIPQHEDIEII
jgi:glycerophosphoryl diester phosphodiesterase